MFSEVEAGTPAATTPAATPAVATEAPPETGSEGSPNLAAEGAPETAEEPGTPEQEAAKAQEVAKLQRAKDTLARVKAQEATRAKQRAKEERRQIEFQKTQHELTQTRAEAQRARQLSEMAQKGDITAVLEALGVPPQQTVDFLIKQIDPQTQRETETQRLERMIREDRAARQAEAERVQQAQIAKNIETLITLAADDTKYPHVSLLPDDMVVDKVRSVLMRAQKASGHQYSFNDALDYLEADFAERAKAKAESKSRKAEAPASDEKNGPASRTITNDLSSRSFSAPKKLDDMTDMEQRQYFSAQIKASLK